MKKRIAIINQRYGLEVNGGSEVYTRMIAEHLRDIYDIEVLTTCALDYDTWKNYYNEGTEYINNVKVTRFANKKQRNMIKFRVISKVARMLPFSSKIIDKLWIKEQGPYCPDLIQYIMEHQDDYDQFIFITYLYYLTATGVPKVADKSIMIPTAHDEPYIHFAIYKDVFEKPKKIIYLTEEEKIMVESVFDVGKKKNAVIAMGIEKIPQTKPERFCKKYSIIDEYIIYIGRIDVGKKCDELLGYFIRYKTENNNNLKLVLLGKCMMEVPHHKDIMSLGFVSDEDKYNALSGAKALVLPSKYESLSISVLEAMSLSVPVIVNGESEVLKAHCAKSNAGLYYESYEEFKGCINRMLRGDREYNNMCQQGKKYIDENYRWKGIISRLQSIIDHDD